MKFNTGLAVDTIENPLGFTYGEGVEGPTPEIRRLDDIRGSLENPECEGPDELYCIAMDVKEENDKKDLEERNLLFGVVTYAAGKVGDGPVRSQGHIHAVSDSCQSSTPEVYEIWEGEAIIYMQESGSDHAGNCYAVHAKAGEVVIVPPYWVHATVNADVKTNMTFGAWCIRDYGFDYDEVRAHKGIAFFPKYRDEKIVWEMNQMYESATLIEMEAREYKEFALEQGKAIYTQYKENHEKFDFVTNPAKYKEIWKQYRP
ncbi:MAG: glucose-6-phosphate isomerase family protein [Anaerostipes sp.]|nr:glucose-6-phosphate isomerase family protein [Anaerostipes sp.]